MLHIIAICTGASLGALLRWQLGVWLTVPGQLAWGTLAANALGGYSIGLAIAWLDASPHIDPIWRLAIITGFLGALTTFSSFSTEVIALLQAQRWGMALLWAMLHLGTSLCLTIAGIYSVHALR
ncbi:MULTISPECIES: fluoride efflux transporter CrcB [Comamonas]|uniref:fluoride efflux transporter CrcB n=1 Tax=Comamonas TaxID=283 RepID=UPI00257DD8C3|nr:MULTISPECIES: fluoride efflux transporter CrcB [Comamonas]